MDDDRREESQPTDERLEALPEHEDDTARGVGDSVGAGVISSGGTAESSDDASGRPVPEEDTKEDQTGLAGMPPGPPART